MLTNQPRNDLPRRDAGRPQLNVLCLIAEAVAWRSSCFDPGPFGVATFQPLEQLPGAKMLQLTLKSLNFVRPVTPELAGSSRVAPARKINDLAEPGPIGYKIQTGAVTKIHGFRSYFFRLRPSSRAASPTLTAVTSMGL
jgi:hypothetical protein